MAARASVPVDPGFQPSARPARMAEPKTAAVKRPPEGKNDPNPNKDPDTKPHPAAPEEAGTSAFTATPPIPGLPGEPIVKPEQVGTQAGVAAPSVTYPGLNELMARGRELTQADVALRYRDWDRSWIREYPSYDVALAANDGDARHLQAHGKLVEFTSIIKTDKGRESVRELKLAPCTCPECKRIIAARGWVF